MRNKKDMRSINCYDFKLRVGDWVIKRNWIDNPIHENNYFHRIHSLDNGVIYLSYCGGTYEYPINDFISLKQFTKEFPNPIQGLIFNQ